MNTAKDALLLLFIEISIPVDCSIFNYLSSRYASTYLFPLVLERRLYTNIAEIAMYFSEQIHYFPFPFRKTTTSIRRTYTILEKTQRNALSTSREYCQY